MSGILIQLSNASPVKKRHSAKVQKLLDQAVATVPKPDTKQLITNAGIRPL